MPVVTLVRHAHAVSEEENPLRPLSERGREECRRLAAFFKDNRAFTPAEFWHSPLVRARETAELLRSALAPYAALREQPGLLPEDNPRHLAARLAELAPTTDIALVGHEPHLSALGTLLVNGRPDPVVFELKKGAMLALARPAEFGVWTVRWQIEPSLLPA